MVFVTLWPLSLYHNLFCCQRCALSFVYRFVCPFACPFASTFATPFATPTSSLVRVFLLIIPRTLHDQVQHIVKRKNTTLHKWYKKRKKEQKQQQQKNMKKQRNKTKPKYTSTLACAAACARAPACSHVACRGTVIPLLLCVGSGLCECEILISFCKSAFSMFGISFVISNILLFPYFYCVHIQNPLITNNSQ